MNREPLNVQRCSKKTDKSITGNRPAHLRWPFEVGIRSAFGVGEGEALDLESEGGHEAEPRV
jgi:hypothetical protein